MSAESTSTAQQTGQKSPSTMVGRYSLTTAIFLIMGICIGSGILFKSDNVLVATSGNVWLGALMFVIAAFYIMFGGLTLSLYAARTDGAGGLVAYAQHFVSSGFARLMGWNYTLIYLPIITAIIFWVVGVYAVQVFALPDTLEVQVAIGAATLALCSILNALAPRAAGHFQSASTIIKIIPLVAVGALGTIFILSGKAQVDAPNPSAIVTAGTGWLLAAAPISYSYDGWPIATSIAPELKNARRNLPIALVVAPLLILALYLTYFLGLSFTLGPQTVMQAGDKSLGLLFERLFGAGSGSWPNLLALLAVLGTGNGLVLSHARMPQALALRRELPASKWLSAVNPRWQMPLHSNLVAFLLTCGWLCVHYLAQRVELIPNGDISEVSIAFTLLMMAPYFICAFKLWRKGEAGFMRGFFSPALALIGCLFVAGSSLSDISRLPGAVLNAAALALIWLLWRRQGEGSGV